MRSDDQVIVITGASSGLGRALTLHLAGDGYRVCALARRASELKRLQQKAPDRIETYVTDVSRWGDVQRAIRAILKRHRKIDVLINNAGVFHTGPFWQENHDTIDRLIDINLKGTMYCSLAAMPSMVKRRCGRIINISSVSGTHGIPGQAIYGASKHGVQGFSDVIAQELKQHNVLVTTICPGGIATPLWDEKQNPYPGAHENLTDPKEICELVQFIITQPTRTLHKQVILFPKSEWH